MLKRLHSRAIALILLAALGLGACDRLAAQLGPTHQYVLRVDGEAVAKEPGDRPATAALVEESIPVLNARLEAMGFTVLGTSRVGSDRLVIDVAGTGSREAIELAVGRTGKLEFKLLDMSALPRDVMEGFSPPGSVILRMTDGSGPVAVRKLGGIDGEHIVDARSIFDPNTNQPAIAIGFDREGAEKLAALTRANVGSPMAIIVDDEVVSAPMIHEPIVGGSLQLAGGFTVESADQFAIMLRSGVLPARFEIIEERSLD